MSTEPTNDVAIAVRDVTKIFKLPHEKNTSIKSAVVSFYKREKGYEIQEALKNVSFEVEKGEFFGIVGRNGSGKSTLLKMLAGIYYPTQGSINVEGKLTPFIELGVGFNPELTGRENVYLNGALLGFSRKEMRGLYQKIVDFAELEKFMDQKLKNYSSGMQVRLAFSIAIQAESDILVLDEVLAVGDLDFQKKCYNYFYDLKKQGRTLIFVTHDMAAVRKFCTRCLLINNGKVIKISSPDEIADMYESVNLRAAEKRLTEVAPPEKVRRKGNGEAVIFKTETFNPSTQKNQNTFNFDEKIGVRITFKAKQSIDKPSVGFIFQNQDDLTVFATNNHIQKQATKRLQKGKYLVMETVVDNVLTDGEYTITCAIESTDFSIIYDRIEYIHKFMIGGHKLPHALVHPSHTMKVLYKDSIS